MNLDLNKGRVIDDIKTRVREACATPHAANPDSVSFHADGTISVRRSYFYRMGRRSDAFALYVEHEISEALRGIGLRAECIEHTDTNRPWPADSFFLARFRLVSTQEEKTS